MTAPADDHVLPLDRFLRYDELVERLHRFAAQHQDLVTLETYGRSHEGRDLWLVTVTDSATGPHHTKPAHWVDASIHAVELTATVAALAVLRHVVDGYAAGNERIVDTLRRRTLYVVPRVNPDGAEWVLADRPRFRRSSTRPWPWRDGHRWPGLHVEDVDGDGRILSMRLPDPDGTWMPHPADARLLVPVPADGLVPPDVPRYRLLTEGVLEAHDGFTVPTPRAVEGLDLNRNFPAGWGTGVTGSGDHPLSEPEIDALVRAIVARPNICGAHAFHTSGGVLLRPSSTEPDAKLPPLDVWVWTRFGEAATAATGYPVHSVYEDFTWDRATTMSGAADDWLYEHLGVYGWTTEFWDVVHAATGTKQSTHFWYVGPTDEEALAVLRWCDEHHPAGHVDWYPFEHPQLGAVELGGWDDLTVWTNPPPTRLAAELAGHPTAVLHQLRCAPELTLPYISVTRLSATTWRVEAGVANTGWLPTHVSEKARAAELVRPVTVELAVASDQGVSVDAGVPAMEVLDGPARRQLGQLEGRAALVFRRRNDGTPDRALAGWLVEAPPGTVLEVIARHDRAGEVRRTIALDPL
jgi:hypothetical protein